MDSPFAWPEGSYEYARERGYLGGVRAVQVDHIGKLIYAAAGIRKTVDGRVFPEPVPGGETEGSFHTERSLEKMANLLRRAAEETDSERLKLRDGWS